MKTKPIEITGGRYRGKFVYYSDFLAEIDKLKKELQKADDLLIESHADKVRYKMALEEIAVSDERIAELEAENKRLREALDKVGGFALGLPSSQVKGNILHIINEALEQSDETK